MTVTTATYTPQVIPYVSGEDKYRFDLEIIGPDAFELWYVTADDERTLARPSEYNVTFFGNPPIYDSGEVEITGTVPDNVETLSIERNTPITQLLDWKAFEPFQMLNVEFTLDKHMMICQEIAYRKCEAEVGDLEMTQLVRFDPYTRIVASEVNQQMQKTIDILLAIATSAESCRDRPEET